MFTVQVLLSIGIEVELPMIICVDNVDAMLMAENVRTSPTTKHVDIHYHFIRKLTEDGFIRMVLTDSRTMRQVCYTKNAVVDLYNKYTKDMFYSAKDMSNEVKDDKQQECMGECCQHHKEF